ALQGCAEELLDSLVLELLQNEVNGLLMSSVKVGGPPDTKSPAEDLLPSINASIERVQSLQKRLELASLAEMAQRHRENLADALRSDGWQRKFPGRSLLRRFAAKHLAGKVDAAIFQN